MAADSGDFADNPKAVVNHAAAVPSSTTMPPRASQSTKLADGLNPIRKATPRSAAMASTLVSTLATT
jgi:hypothetical protein